MRTKWYDEPPPQNESLGRLILIYIDRVGVLFSCLFSVIIVYTASLYFNHKDLLQDISHSILSNIDTFGERFALILLSINAILVTGFYVTRILLYLSSSILKNSQVLNIIWFVVTSTFYLLSMCYMDEVVKPSLYETGVSELGSIFMLSGEIGLLLWLFQKVSSSGKDATIQIQSLTWYINRQKDLSNFRSSLTKINFLKS